MSEYSNDIATDFIAEVAVELNNRELETQATELTDLASVDLESAFYLAQKYDFKYNYSQYWH